MNKKNRKIVFEKYGGLCAYTGKPLGDDWQVDHVISKVKHRYITFGSCSNVDEALEMLKEVDNIDNLLPAIKIVNHYKRGLDLEGFRNYMMKFHERIAKLPKKTIIHRTQKRKEYMLKIAELFDISVDKPFSGIFYFETIKT